MRDHRPRISAKVTPIALFLPSTLVCGSRSEPTSRRSKRPHAHSLSVGRRQGSEKGPLSMVNPFMVYEDAATWKKNVKHDVSTTSSIEYLDKLRRTPHP